MDRPSVRAQRKADRQEFLAALALPLPEKVKRLELLAELNDRSRRLDFLLMQRSCVTIYRRMTLLDAAVRWLTAHGYHVTCMDAGSWADEEAAFEAFAWRLDFPDSTERNLKRLNVYLGAVVDGDHGWEANSNGLAIVLTGYHAFAQRCPAAAHALLDVIARQSRVALLFGRRMLCLVQTDDPQLRFPPIGAVKVAWNAEERCFRA